MKKIERLVEKLYERRIDNELDVLIPVVGPEGMGKSTLISEIGFLYQDVRDGERDPDGLLDAFLGTRQEVKQAAVSRDKRSIMPIPDAGRVLHRKQSTTGEQVEIENDIADLRTLNFFWILGYQYTDQIASFVSGHRATMVLRVPRRGRVLGYSSGALEHVLETGDWPDPDLKDTFPSLDGTDYWERYKQQDEEEKLDRARPEAPPDPAEAKKEAQRRVVLRMAAEGLSYREIADYVDWGRGWVGNTVREFRRGAYRDIWDETSEMQHVLRAVTDDEDEEVAV